MKRTARFGPGPIVFVLYMPMYVYSLLLVGFGAPASGGVWSLIAMLGATIVVLSVQSWAPYLEVDVDEWLLRGLLRERTIPTTLVRGIRVERFVDVVAVGGVPYLIRWGAARPTRSRQPALAERLSEASGIDISFLTLTQVESMRRQLTPEETGLLHECRSRWVRLAWWQWALYGVWLLAVVLLAT